MAIILSRPVECPKLRLNSGVFRDFQCRQFQRLYGLARLMQSGLYARKGQPGINVLRVHG